MGISASDVIPLSHARANFSELAEEVKAGAEKIIPKMAKVTSPSSTRTGWTTTISLSASAFTCY